MGGTTETMITWAVADDAGGEVAWALMMDGYTCLFSARRGSRPGSRDLESRLVRQALPTRAAGDARTVTARKAIVELRLA